MVESTRYGYLCAQDGSPLSNEMTARGCGLPLSDFELGMTELTLAGLLPRDKHGVIFDQEMLDFEREYNTLTSKAQAIDDRRVTDAKRQQKQRTSRDEHIYSSSPSLIPSFRKEVKKPKNEKTPWPEGFELTEKLIMFAVENGIDRADVARKWAHFEAHHKKKADRFANWEQAWRTWVFNDPRFGGNGGGNAAVASGQRKADATRAEALRRMG